MMMMMNLDSKRSKEKKMMTTKKILNLIQTNNVNANKNQVFFLLQIGDIFFNHLLIFMFDDDDDDGFIYETNEWMMKFYKRKKQEWLISMEKKYSNYSFTYVRVCVWCRGVRGLNFASNEQKKKLIINIEEC